MISDSQEIEAGATLEADVCIVGTGPAGMALARRLDANHVTVMLLESGGFNLEQEVQALYAGRNVGRPYFSLDSCRSRYLGGSSNCWQGLCHTLDPDDFTKRAWVPHSGWPFGAQDLEPHYRAAARMLGLRGKGFAASEWASAQRPEWKVAGGRIQSGVLKGSPEKLPRSTREHCEKSEHIRTVLHASVTSATLGDAGVEELVVKRTLGGAGFKVRARRYVLACGAIENPRLLLNWNIGNQHDLVGRYFMEHPHVDRVGFLLGSPGAPAAGFYRGHAARGRQRIWGYFALTAETRAKEQLLNSVTVFLGAVTESSDLDRALGAVLTEMDGEAEAKTGELVHFPFGTPSEQVPNPDSRVKLGAERDALGLLRPELDWRLTEFDKRSVMRTHQILAEDFARSRLGRVRVMLDGKPDFPKSVHGGRHHMGTTRMHEDPKQGVVDANCAVHGVPNLHIAGSSVFPTCGAANPTLTIVALALRLADHLREGLDG